MNVVQERPDLAQGACQSWVIDPPVTGIEHEVIESLVFSPYGSMFLAVQREQFVLFLLHDLYHAVAFEGLEDVDPDDQRFRGKQHEIAEELTLELVGEIDGCLVVAFCQCDSGAEGIAQAQFIRSPVQVGQVGGREAVVDFRRDQSAGGGA